MTGRLRLQARVRDSALGRFPHARPGSRVMRTLPALPWRIPGEVIRAVRSFFEETSDLRDPDVVEARYRDRGLRTVAEPMGADVPQLIIDALQAQRPFSVVRIGDRETNILTYGMYPGTPARRLVDLEHHPPQ